ncbi:GMC family oxidoreductase [Halorubrum amylolyticum]|uniref:GMC family oxidoreductase n=1 Tax=Halorubrum amylolyticum TaxID=2508724 RepID=UPI0010086ACE|nr:GMC family oxidoreductase [Halorubrum amylolyticum]
MSADDGRPTQVDRSPSPRADVCVVGAGVAGGLLAHSLATAGLDVVVLEAGPRFEFDSRIDRMERALRPDSARSVWDMGGERDAFTSSGPKDYDLNHRRVKGVGGTTLHWAGYTPRLHEKDFAMRSRYGLASDWPLGYDDLRPYFAAAETELGVAGGDDNPFSPPRELDHPLPPFPTGPADSRYVEACSNLGITLHSAPQARNSEAYDGRSPCIGYSTCIPVCPSGAKYSGDVHVRKAEEAGARVVDRAPVQSLKHDDAGETVEAAVYNTPDAMELRQEARYFVLAGGGVEIPRLLLSSTSEAYPDGLANSSGLVGSYFMEHPIASVRGTIPKPDGQEPIFWWPLESHQFYDHEETTPGSIKLEFKQGSQTEPTDVLSGFDSLAGNIADPLAGDDLSVKGGPEWDGWRLTISALVEMLPRERNRVALDESQTDDHGNPVPDVALDVGKREVETLERAIDIGTRILESMGATDIETTDPENPGYASHHMGTTRMGEDPTESVVNPQLRTHDLDNLFISSSSVFVTAGAMNPTLTIAALSLRLAEHIGGLD